MQDNYSGRQYVIQGFFLLIAIVLIIKCIQLQLVSDSYRSQADATAIHEITLYPSRGLIADRNGEMLVNNVPMYDIMVTYNQIGKDIDTAKLCTLLNISLEEFEANLDKDWVPKRDFSKNRRFSKSKPFAFLKKVSATTYARFQENLYEFPGFFVQRRNARNYPYPYAAHTLGYLIEVNQKQIDEGEGIYQLGDYIGASGLEQQYEPYLRGKKGSKYVLKDNLGRIKSSYRNGAEDSLEISGYDLITSLDINLQVYGELLMKNKRGSIVAIEPSSGEILAMVSSPSYDPNLLSINQNRGDAFSKLVQDDTLKPLLDRAVMAQYPPGSIFKSAMALVAMETSVWAASRGFGCPGYYNYGGSRPMGCHGHPYPSNVAMGLQHSCNAYFGQVFRDVIEQYGYYEAAKGLDTLVSYLAEFGLGDRLGVDLPQEKGGNIPDANYYDRRYRKGGWKAPTIISVSIGQGEIELTTLQMANLSAMIANKGYFVTPHFGKELIDIHNNRIPIPQDTTISRVATTYFEPVIEGMRMAVTGGTARVANIPDIEICGKTGTSENPHGKDHSVFIAFAPKDNPKIAIAVFVENAGYGASYAAPIASLMVEQYLKGEIDPSRAYLEDRMKDANLLYSW